mmetsp:Transcript_43433/g.47116  ORF Transcript_43433/g.47116 Transcript_43433/m.47116 type:complete len:524 (+) Transcript_43433:77-1648(+)
MRKAARQQEQRKQKAKTKAKAKSTSYLSFSVIIIIGIRMVILLSHSFTLDLDTNVTAPTASASTTSKKATATKASETSVETAAAKPTFPETRFTPHVREVIGVIENVTFPRRLGEIEYWPERYCSNAYRIIVDEPYTAPSRIECRASDSFCRFTTLLFSSNTTILPFTISVGYNMVDRNKGYGLPWGNCISSSAPRGLFTMTNFQDIKEHAMKRNEANGYVHNHKMPWEERHKIPVFRGHPRMTVKKNPKACPKHVSGMGHRPKVADFSLDHPDLINAAIGINQQSNHPCLSMNATNGMDRIYRLGAYTKANSPELPPTTIKMELYYTTYQTVVVLGGIGAAFRTGRHLSAGQAVVLQDFNFVEWFVPYMKPYVHYIPLKEDLSDLTEVMEWVRDHPIEVKKIAEEGEKFYWDYLSFEHTENHWHELFWRLALTSHKDGQHDRLKYGKGRAIWPGTMVPTAFERGRDGEWKETVDVKEELAKEDSAMAKISNDLMWLPGYWQGGIAMNNTNFQPIVGLGVSVT